MNVNEGDEHYRKRKKEKLLITPKFKKFFHVKEQTAEITEMMDSRQMCLTEDQQLNYIHYTVLTANKPLTTVGHKMARNKARYSIQLSG